jgi:hemolysin activation/secretion protein
MRLCSRLTSLFLITTCLLIAVRALAADFPSASTVNTDRNIVTNLTDPGRASNQLQTNMGTLSGVNRVSQAHPAAVATKASKITFHLGRVIFEGNKAFSAAELLVIFKPYLDKSITLGQLEGLVHAVSVKYREAGYILTRAILPPQTIKSGTVKVRVIEGYISSFSVKGNPGMTKKLLMKYGDHIMEVKPLEIHNLQRYTLLANDLPGFTIQSLITPSETVPAGADLTFITERQRYSLYLSYDNEGTRFLGPQETNLGFNLFSIIAPGDNLLFRFTVTGRPQELRFLELIHVQPIGSRGLKWQFGTNYAETRPQFILAPVNLVGRNFLTFTDFSFPWIRDRAKNFITHAAFNYQNVTATILSQPFYEDRIRSLVVGASFDNNDQYRGSNSFSFDMTRGFPFWGAHNHENQSRPEGTSNYIRMDFSASRLQGLTQHFTFLTSMHMQYSFEPLLATEQFGVGGPDIGRGYDPSEIVGDQGIGGKIELQLNTFPGFKYFNAIQYYIFYDAGIIKNKDSTNLPNQQSLTSAGGGVRVNFFPSVSGNLFIGKPITRQVAVLTAEQSNSTGARVFFSIVMST